eukprot:6479988-Amphidinium_carterae.1
MKDLVANKKYQTTKPKAQFQFPERVLKSLRASTRDGTQVREWDSWEVRGREMCDTSSWTRLWSFPYSLICVCPRKWIAIIGNGDIQEPGKQGHKL